jgi:hypothetical protein
MVMEWIRICWSESETIRAANAAIFIQLTAGSSWSVTNGPSP